MTQPAQFAASMLFCSFSEMLMKSNAALATLLFAAIAKSQPPRVLAVPVPEYVGMIASPIVDGACAQYGALMVLVQLPP